MTPDPQIASLRAGAGPVPLRPGFIPVSVDLDCTAAPVIWCDAQGLRLEDPFFIDSIKRLASQQPLCWTRTGLAELLAMQACTPRVAPAALIFHASRCGSTAVTNALQALTGSAVIAEAPAINGILAPHDWNGEPHDPAALLAATVSILAGACAQDAARVFIKFTSWNMFKLREIRMLWPRRPWIFIYRHPVEIMMSQLENRTDRTGWLAWRRAPGLTRTLTGWDDAFIQDATDEDYCARMIGDLFWLARREGRRHLMPYDAITASGLGALVSGLGIRPTESELAAMSDSLFAYSKDPTKSTLFIADSGHRRRSASETIHRAAERWAMRPFAALNSAAARERPADR